MQSGVDGSEPCLSLGRAGRHYDCCTQAYISYTHASLLTSLSRPGTLHSLPFFIPSLPLVRSPILFPTFLTLRLVFVQRRHSFFPIIPRECLNSCCCLVRYEYGSSLFNTHSHVLPGVFATGPCSSCSSTDSGFVQRLRQHRLDPIRGREAQSRKCPQQTTSPRVHRQCPISPASAHPPIPSSKLTLSSGPIHPPLTHIHTLMYAPPPIRRTTHTTSSHGAYAALDPAIQCCFTTSPPSCRRRVVHDRLVGAAATAIPLRFSAAKAQSESALCLPRICAVPPQAKGQGQAGMAG